jgi:hypothetical protein
VVVNRDRGVPGKAEATQLNPLATRIASQIHATVDPPKVYLAYLLTLGVGRSGRFSSD